MRRSSLLAAAAALLHACGPLPCKYPEVRADLAEIAVAPADGVYSATLERGDWMVIAGTGGHVLRATTVKRNGYDPVGVRYSDSIPDTGTTATLRGLAYAPAGNLYAVGDGGVVRVSPDQGKTWRASESGTAADLYAVADGDGTTVIVGDGVVLRSIDAGASWTPSALPSGGVALRDVNHRTLSWLAVGLDGVILRSTDDAATWEADPSPTAGDLRRIHGAKGEPMYLVGAEGLWFGGDDGWEPVELPFTGEIADASEVTVVMRDGRLAHRDFAGQRFRAVTIDEKFSFARLVVEPNREPKAVLLADDGELVFVDLLIVDRHSDRECWATDFY